MKVLFNHLFINCDTPRPWGLYFQDSASPQMEALVELHDNIMFYLVIILFAVAWGLVSIIRNYVGSKYTISNKYLNHGTLIELIWTITPALILILIAFPSFKLLYLMDEVTDPSLTLFVEGHQWYLNYQCPNTLYEDNEKLDFFIDDLRMNETGTGEQSNYTQPIEQYNTYTSTSIGKYINLQCFKLPRDLFANHTLGASFFVYDSNDYTLLDVSRVTHRVITETVELTKDNVMHSVTGFRRTKVPREYCVEVLFDKQLVDWFELKHRVLVNGYPIVLDDSDSNAKYYRIRVPINKEN